MTGAIVHHSKIMPLHKIPEEEVRIAEDLIFDRRAGARIEIEVIRDGTPLTVTAVLLEVPARRP